MESGYILCWAAKWVGEDHIFFSSKQHKTTGTMLSQLHALLEEADAVVHYNGRKFDIPTINREFLQLGWHPPSTYRQIDLLETVKKEFKFPSNKLEYVSKSLGLGQKVKHVGHELWIGCIQGDAACWKDMEKYNIQDVHLLEKLYFRLRPWIKNHANFSIYEEDKEVCPNCGSKHYHKRGFAYTLSNKYQRFQCQDCGNWFRATKSESKPGKKFVNVST